MKKAKKWSKYIVSFALAALLCFGLIPFGQFGGILAAGGSTGPADVVLDEYDDFWGSEHKWIVEPKVSGEWGTLKTELLSYANNSQGVSAPADAQNGLRFFDEGSGGDMFVYMVVDSLPAGKYTLSTQVMGENSYVQLVLGDQTDSATYACTGWNDWVPASKEFIVQENQSNVKIGYYLHASSSAWGYVDGMSITGAELESGDTGSESEEGYSIQVTPSASDVLEGTKVSLTATVTKDGETVTDLEAEGIYLYWYADKWLEGHENGRTDVTLDNDNNSGHTLSADVTPNSVGTYYIAAKLQDSEWNDIPGGIVTATITSTVDNSTAVEADIFVKKVGGLSEDFISGMDISSYIAEKDSGVKFYDFDGNELDDQGFFDFLHDICGVNYVRLRVWNDPYYVAEDGSIHGYGGGNNDLEKAIRMGKWATNANMKVLIDFHYSDFWADPAKQQAPKAWEGLSVEEKAVKVSEFTTESLNALLDAGVDVGMVQVGNETNGAVAGVQGLDGMCVLFKAGCEAVDAVEEARGKEILTALHFTNPETSGRYASYAKALDENNVPYDIFASSYYPEWHGTLDNLTNVLGNVAKTYDKMVMVAETNYPFTDEAGDEPGLIDKSGTFDYNISVQGQADELRAVINAVNSIGEKGIGVFWWESAWIPVSRCDSTVDEQTANERWENNKKIWETYGSGWASSWGGYYDETGDAAEWYGGSAADHKSMFDFDGHPLASIMTFKYVYTGATSTVRMDVIKEFDKITVTSGEEIPWPATVTVCYNDGTTDEVEVVWNAEQKAKVDGAGSYVVDGTVTIDGQTFDTSIEIEILPRNLLVNGGFENGDTSWTVENVVCTDGNGAKITDSESGNAHSGSWHLHFWDSADFEYHVYQTVTGLEPGLYALSAYLEGGGAGESDEYILYAEADGKNYTAAAALKGYQNFDHPTIKNIEVGADGKITVGAKVKASAGAWGGWDDFHLYALGEVKPTVNVGTGAPEAALEDSRDDILAAVGGLTDEEMKYFNDGARLDIKLSIDDVTKTISDADKKLIEEAANGYTIGQYLDINLAIVIGDNYSRPISDLAAGKTVKISIVVPDALLNKDSNVTRTYKIVRIHNGQAALLDTVFDVETGKLSFMADGFSTYAIAYSDETKTVDSEPADSEKTNTEQASSEQTNTEQTNSEKTDTTVTDSASDNTSPQSPDASVASGNTGDVPIAIYIILLVVAAALIATVVVVRKKNNNK